MEIKPETGTIVDKTEIKEEVNKVAFERRFRYFVFILIFVINVVVNMDHGTIPAATKEIMISLNVSEKTLGIFGSLVYLGNIIGNLLINL